MRRSLLLAFIVLVPLLPGCLGIGRSECGPYREAVVDAGITQGIAGYTARNETCMPPAVCTCRPIDVSFDVFFVGDAVLADDDDAQRFIERATPIRVTTGLDGYEQALDVGRFIACVNMPGALDDIDAHGCLDFHVEADRVTTIHATDAGEGSVPALQVLDDEGRSVSSRQFVVNRTLPRLAADIDCEPLPAPTFCEWATSVDTLVVATIVGVEPLTSPAEKATSITSWDLVDDSACDEVVNPGLLLHLELQQRLRGEGVTSTFAVRVGADQAAMFDDSVGTLDVGETIGLPLHRVVVDDDNGDDELWSLLGERLLAPFRGRVSFQRGTEDCMAPPPADIDLRWFELGTAVDACRNLELGAQRRSDQRRAWGPDGASPSAYMAGQCTDPIPE